MTCWMRWTIPSFCFLVACEPDATNPTGFRVSVCHKDGTAAALAEIPLADLAAHKSHGDYVAQLVVDRAGGTGDSIHFTRVTDAVEVARAGRITRSELTTAACRITILVVPGTFTGTAAQSSDNTIERFPIVIDVPDITLKGSMKMQLDAKGRATGVALTGEVSTFAPSPPLIVEGGGTFSQQGVSQEIIVINAHPQGSRGDGAIIEGFLFQNGRAASDTIVGGQGILSMRVTGLEVRGNRFEGTFTETMDLRATSAIVEENYLIGRGAACDICIAGPGTYIVRDNRLDGPGGIPGILSTPVTLLPVPSIVEQYVLPASATIISQIHNNEVRNHRSRPVGAGIRIGAMGVGAPAVIGISKATITGNTLVGNTFGLIFEAAFPVANGSLRGDLDVATSDNAISQSCQIDVLVAFTRHTALFGISNQPYLRNATYVFNFGADISWDKAWLGHAPGFGNKLTVNDVVIDNAIRHSFDAARVCS